MDLQAAPKASVVNFEQLCHPGTPGLFQLSFSTGRVIAERYSDGRLSAEFFPRDQWGKAYRVEVSTSGEIASVVENQRTHQPMATGQQKLPGVFREHLTRRILPANSTDWSQVLADIQSGMNERG